MVTISWRHLTLLKCIIGHVSQNSCGHLIPYHSTFRNAFRSFQLSSRSAMAPSIASAVLTTLKALPKHETNEDKQFIAILFSAATDAQAHTKSRASLTFRATSMFRVGVSVASSKFFSKLSRFSSSQLFSGPATSSGQNCKQCDRWETFSHGNRRIWIEGMGHIDIARKPQKSFRRNQASLFRRYAQQFQSNPCWFFLYDSKSGKGNHRFCIDNASVEKK